MCWEKIKPTIRGQWRAIKERRRLRRAVDQHVNEQTRLRLAVEAEARERADAAARRAEMTAVTESRSAYDFTPEQAQAEIDRLKAAGLVPPPGPERGHYMQLHRVARGERNNGATFVPTAQEQLVARLYIDTDVPVGELLYAVRLPASALFRIRTRTGTAPRDQAQRWNPKGRILENEELVVRGLEAVFRDKATGKERPVWPEPVLSVATDPPVSEEVQQQAREAFDAAMADPEPVAEKIKARHTRRMWSPAQKAEIARLYDDPSIPINEIVQAYDIGDSNIYRFAQELGVPTRRMENRPKGRIVHIDDMWQWKSYEDLPEDAEPAATQQIEEAPPVRPAAPTTNGFQPIVAEARPVVLEPEEQVRSRAFSSEVNQLQSLAVPPVPQVEHAWYVRFVVTQQGIIGAASFDEVSRKLREQFGQDVEIIMVQRA